MEELLALAIGALTGTASSFFGIGGALIGTPLVRLLLDLPPHLALGTPLPAAIPGALSGSYVYHSHRLINYKIAWITILCGFPANVAGTYLTQFVSGQFLMVATGIMMIIVGSTFFVRGWLLKPSEEQEVLFSLPIIVGVGLLTGFLSGFLAIGGGTVMVPAFVKLLRLNVKTALATSLFCVLFLAIPATIGHFMLGHIDVPTAVLLSIATFVSAFLAAKFAVRLRNQTLERLYGTFMTAFAIYFIVVHLL